MILVYYRRKDGTIRHFHQYPAERGIDAANDSARHYNIAQAGVDTAYVVEFDDNSIEAFLYRKSIEKYKYSQGTVGDLVSLLNEALDTARSLEG